MQTPLVDYFSKELNYLRHIGRSFSKEHSEIASRLRLGEGASEDPHVGRLLEAFSFLAARIHHRLDHNFADLVDLFLGTYYPDFNAPIPASSVVSFAPKEGSDTAVTIPKGTRLEIKNPQQRTIEFTSSYDVTTWPIALENVKFEEAPFSSKNDYRSAKALISISLSTKIFETNFRSLQEAGLKALPVFLSLAPEQAFRWIDMIANHLMGATLSTGTKEIKLDKSRFIPMGYEESEDLGLLGGPHLPALVRLYEFFALPRKFSFFKINFEGLPLDEGDEYELSLYFDHVIPSIDKYLHEKSFVLFATPIVNLFETKTTPIKLSHESDEIALEAGLGGHQNFEIHSVLEIGVDIGQGNVHTYEPFFKPKPYKIGKNTEERFWLGRRRQASMQHSYEMAGTNFYLDLLAQDFSHLRYESSAYLNAKLRCTNRDSARSLEEGFESKELKFGEASFPIEGIKTVAPLSSPHWPALGEEQVFRLMSILDISELLPREGENQGTSLERLNTLVRAYNIGGNQEDLRILSDIEGIETRQSLAPMLVSNECVLASGHTITFKLSRTPRSGSLYVFFSILNRVFAESSNFNSFTELELKLAGEKKIWKRFAPRTANGRILSSKKL